MRTYVAAAELLKDGVEATVKYSRVTDSYCCSAPDKLDGVGQRVDVQLLPINCPYTRTSSSSSSSSIFNSMLLKADLVRARGVYPLGTLCKPPPTNVESPSNVEPLPRQVGYAQHARASEKDTSNCKNGFYHSLNTTPELSKIAPHDGNKFYALSVYKKREGYSYNEYLGTITTVV